MKFTFNSADYAGDPGTLGEIVSTFLRTQTHHGISHGFRPTVPGWTTTVSTPPAIADALSGDEPATIHHFVHDATDLQVAWACDGDISIVVWREPEETSTEIVEPGFSIINHHGGRSGDWANY